MKTPKTLFTPQSLTSSCCPSQSYIVQGARSWQPYWQSSCTSANAPFPFCSPYYSDPAFYNLQYLLQTKLTDNRLLILKWPLFIAITLGALFHYLLVGYAIADHAGNYDTRRSAFDYIFSFRSNPISWSSKGLAVVAIYSNVAEYYALI
jgi:hypothetical protein